jgi:hypothetical protein
MGAIQSYYAALPADDQPTALEKHQAYQKKQHRDKTKWQQAAIPFVGVSTIALSLTGTIALHLLQPGIPIPALITMAISGLLVDGLMYWGSVRETFALLRPKRGLHRDLKEHLIEASLLEALQTVMTNNTAIENFITVKDIAKIQEGFATIEKKVNENTANTTQKTKAQLVKQKREKHLRKFIRDIIIHWRITSKNPESSEEKNSLLDKGAAYINSTICPSINTEYWGKLIGSYLMLIVAMISGLAFGALVFTHLMELGCWGVTAFSATIASIFAICSCGLLFRTFYNMIKDNVFMQIKQKLFPAKPDDRSWPSHIAITAIRFIFASAVVAIGLIATILLASSLLDSSINFLSLFFTGGVPKSAVLATQILLLGVLLPARTIFSIKHSLGAFSQIYTAAERKIEWLVDKESNTSWTQYFQEKAKNPSRTAAYVVAVTVLGFLSLFHFIGDAAFGAGEGATAENSWFSQTFETIADALHVDPNNAALADATLSEALEHSDFVLDQGDKLINGEKAGILPSITTFFTGKAPKFGYAKLTETVMPPKAAT